MWNLFRTVEWKILLFEVAQDDLEMDANDKNMFEKITASAFIERCATFLAKHQITRFHRRPRVEENKSSFGLSEAHSFRFRVKFTRASLSSINFNFPGLRLKFDFVMHFSADNCSRSYLRPSWGGLWQLFCGVPRNVCNVSSEFFEVCVYVSIEHTNNTNTERVSYTLCRRRIWKSFKGPGGSDFIQ